MPEDIIQQRAFRTWHSKNFPDHLQRTHAALGLVGEAGEYAEMVKKDLFKPGYKSGSADRLDELGDVLYYLVILAALDGCTIEDLSRRNAAKLTDGHGWEPDNYNPEGPGWRRNTG